MYFMRIPLVIGLLTAITLAFVLAVNPWGGASAQPVHEVRDAWEVSGSSAPSVAPVVLNALADDNNTQVYVRVNQARYAAYYKEARARCSMYRGEAWEHCVGEARLKFGPPLLSPRLISPPL